MHHAKNHSVGLSNGKSTFLPALPRRKYQQVWIIPDFLYVLETHLVLFEI